MPLQMSLNEVQGWDVLYNIIIRYIVFICSCIIVFVDFKNYITMCLVYDVSVSKDVKPDYLREQCTPSEH